MNRRQIITICLAAALIQITACSKAPSNVEPVAAQKTPAERIAEIDRLLSAPLSGTPEDTDRRIALRGERAALAGSNNHTVANAQSAAVAANQATQAKADEQEHARQIALQQETFRNIERREREQAARERQQASSHSRFETQPDGPVYNRTHQSLIINTQGSGNGQGGAYNRPHP